MRRLVRLIVVFLTILQINYPVFSKNSAQSLTGERWIQSIESFETLDHGLIASGFLNDETKVYLRIDVLAMNLIRFRVNLQNEFILTLQEEDGFIKHDWPQEEFVINEDPKHITIKTERITVSIQKDPFRLKTILDDSLVVQSSAQKGFRFSKDQFELSMKSPESEMFLGLGYHGSRYVWPFEPDRAPMNWRGRSVQMLGLSNHRIYYIPFFLSSQGYGFFLNTLTESFWDMAKSDTKVYSIMVDEPQLDFYLIAGPEFKKILQRYTELTGRPDMPPKWLLGGRTGARLMGIGQDANSIPYHGWDVRWFDQKQALANAKTIRNQQIPADYYHFDSGWQTIRNSFDWVSQIPNPGLMLDSLNAMHFKVGLWTRPTLHVGDYPLYNEAKKQGYLVLGTDGQPYKKTQAHELKTMVDFTNPSAVIWWHNHLTDLIDLGARTFKMDSESGGWDENLPEAKLTRFHNGRTGRELEQYMGPLHAQTVFRALRESLNGKRAVMQMYHPVYFASGRYPFLALGDRTPRTTLALRLGIAINNGLCGIPFWDGGEFNFFGLPMVNSELRRELIPYTYTYWYESHITGLPILRAMPLEYQNDPQSFHAETQLMYGKEFLVAPGVPGSSDEMRTYPNEFWNERDERWESNEHWRRVYLPAGEWVNYWTKEKYLGPKWHYFKVVEDRSPTFVRGGAIIPKGPLMEYMEQKPMDPLTLEIFPENESNFIMYEDDGDSYEYEGGKFSKTEFICKELSDGIRIEIKPTKGLHQGILPQRSYILKIFGVTRPNSITIDGRRVHLKDDALKENENSEWLYNFSSEFHREVVIRIPDVKKEKGATIQLVGAQAVKQYF